MSAAVHAMSVTFHTSTRTGTEHLSRHDPDGPYCHFLDPDDQPICGATLRPTRLRAKHLSSDCSTKGCVRCPECARIRGL